jgi:hypothetical protein
VRGDGFALVVKRHHDLPVESQISQQHLVTERGFVDGFEESSTQMAVDFDRAADDFRGEVGMNSVVH